MASHAVVLEEEDEPRTKTGEFAMVLTVCNHSETLFRGDRSRCCVLSNTDCIAGVFFVPLCTCM